MVTDLYYKTTAEGSYTKLTGTDAEEAVAVGGTANELVLWIRSDTVPTKTIWFATNDDGTNETKLTISFTAYTEPSNNNNGNVGNSVNAGVVPSGSGVTPSPTETGTSENDKTTTASTTLTPTIDTAGNATAKVDAAAVGTMVESAKAAEAERQKHGN